MQPIRLVPHVHLFVCTNERQAESPLGTGCAAHGEALYTELKTLVTQRGLVRTVWVTKTHCLGICPKGGATAVSYPATRMWGPIQAQDAATLLDDALQGKARGQP